MYPGFPRGGQFRIVALPLGGEQRLLPLVDGLLDLMRATGEGILHTLLRAELSERVRAVVGGLPPEQRMVIVLRYTQGLSYEEISDALGCSTGTVASRLNRAHKVLERRLAHLVETRGGGDGR